MISRDYRRAIRDTLIVQVILVVFFGLLLDGGFMGGRAILSVIAFWIVTAIIIVRRPKTPTKIDLFFIRCGYVFVLVATLLFTVLWLGFRPEGLLSLFQGF